MSTIVQRSTRGIIETVLALLFLLILLWDLYLVLSVFFGVFTYAIIFSVSFAAPFERLVVFFKNRRKLAAIIYGLILLLIIALPFVYIITALSTHASGVATWIAEVKEKGVPPLPDWISTLPIVGEKLSTFWQAMRANPSNTLTTYEPQISAAVVSLVSGGAGIFGATLEFVIGIIVSAMLLAGKNSLLPPLYRTMKSLAGINEGPELINATGRAVKGVAVGVMGSAFIAAFFAWIGFAIAGIPFAIGLAAITFFLVVIQVGPLLVWVPVAIWLATHGQTGWAIFITVYGLVVLTAIDNILKPILIAKSGKLPVLILFLGVIGGLVAWGFTGMFKGAIILAVFYTIFWSWHDKQKDDLPPDPAIS
ncbi:AI-2E family transporter [Pollutibacter soli]|uniref:AI-2E family transporter n=1 Tax=Pollutibacter soli TaxID=3034157 RepID=UPI003013F75B